MALLYRPLAHWERHVADLAINNEISQFSTLARQLCLENAVRVAEIVSLYTKQFNIRNLFGTTMQHAGTAVSILVAHVSSGKDSTEQDKYSTHITTLRGCLSGMGETYAPAQKMSKVLESILRQPFNANNVRMFPSPAASANNAGANPELHATQDLARSVDFQSHSFTSSVPISQDLTSELDPINEDWESFCGTNAIQDDSSDMLTMTTLEGYSWELEDLAPMQGQENWNSMYPLNDNL